MSARGIEIVSPVMASGDPSAASGLLPQLRRGRRYVDVVSAEPFLSFSQNGEDVVLMRALGHLGPGRYIEVGANDPTDDSVTRAFYNRGWSGITVEPMQDYAQRHRQQRPRDILVEA